MAQQLPRYQRPASLIQSPDVTGTNISALVQAEAQKTQAITSALDKLIGYAIDVGEKKEKEQKELLELEAISEFPTYSYEIDNHISDLTAQVESGKIETEEQLNKEILYVRNVISPVFKKSEKVWNKLTQGIDKSQQDLSKILNTKLVTAGEANSLKQFESFIDNARKQFTSHLKYQNNGQETLNEIAQMKTKLRQILEIDSFTRYKPDLIEKRLKEFDDAIKLDIVAHIVEIGDDKNYFPTALSVTNRMLNNNLVFKEKDQNGNIIVRKDLNSVWNMLDEKSQNEIRDKLLSNVKARIEAEKAAVVQEEENNKDLFYKVATELKLEKHLENPDLEKIRDLETELLKYATTSDLIDEYKKFDEMPVTSNEKAKTLLEQQILLGNIQNKTQLRNQVMYMEAGINAYKELEKYFTDVTVTKPKKDAETLIFQESGIIEGLFYQSVTTIKNNKKLAIQKIYNEKVSEAEKAQAELDIDKQKVINYTKLAIDSIAEYNKEKESGLSTKQQSAKNTLDKQSELITDNFVEFNIAEFDGEEEELKTRLESYIDPKLKKRFFSNIEVNAIIIQWKTYNGLDLR